MERRDGSRVQLWIVFVTGVVGIAALWYAIANADLDGVWWFLLVIWGIAFAVTVGDLLRDEQPAVAGEGDRGSILRRLRRGHDGER